MYYWYPYQGAPCPMRLILVEPPAVEPLTASEAKARLAIGDTVSDEVVDAWIMAARQQIDGADGYLGRALITQTWQGQLGAFPTENSGRISMPLPPLQQINSISYLDSGGNAVELDPTSYRVLQGPRPYIMPAYGASWPAVTARDDAITIEFVAGYGDDGSSVPEPIRTAIALGASNFRTMSARNLSVTLEREEGIGETRYQFNAETSKVIDDTMECLLSIYRVIKV